MSNPLNVSQFTLEIVVQDGFWVGNAALDSFSVSSVSLASVLHGGRIVTSAATFTGAAVATAKHVADPEDSATFADSASSNNPIVATGFTGFIGNRLSRLGNVIPGYGCAIWSNH